MPKYEISFKNTTRSILLVAILLILAGSATAAGASSYYSLTKETRMTVTPPSVILQNGTAGNSTIYANNTNAKVYDIPAGTEEPSIYHPSSNMTLTGTYVSGNLSSLQTVDTDYFVTNSRPTEWATLATRPTADGTFTAWTGTHTDVNETEQDGDTSYVSATATGLSESYQLQNHTTETEPISNVRVTIYARQTSDDEQLYITLVVNATEYLGTLIEPKKGPIYREYTSDWGTNPATGEDWTWSDIDTLEAGIRSLANGVWAGEERVTQLYVEVTYEKPITYKVDNEFEFNGMPTEPPTKLNFTIVSEYDIGTVSVTIGIWDYTINAWNNTYQYTSTGVANETHTITITTDPANYTSNGYAKIHIEGEKATSTLFQQNTNQLKLDYTYAATRVYDYTLRVNNTVTDSWQIRLRKYADSNISRLQNCTIYFYNSTNGTSGQIYIENGNYTLDGQVGPWFDLTSFETNYIAATAAASSPGTSYIYVYLEIRIPDTTTYARYRITFEIA